MRTAIKWTFHAPKQFELHSWRFWGRVLAWRSRKAYEYSRSWSIRDWIINSSSAFSPKVLAVGIQFGIHFEPRKSAIRSSPFWNCRTRMLSQHCWLSKNLFWTGNCQSHRPNCIRIVRRGYSRLHLVWLSDSCPCEMQLKKLAYLPCHVLRNELSSINLFWCLI